MGEAEPDLLPCPFCATPGRLVSYYHPRCPFSEPWYVQCSHECKISPETGVYGSKEDAALEWNSGVTWLLAVVEHDVEEERLWATPIIAERIRTLRPCW